ncbi:MAG TPA: DnaJ C-terminal domain-containing protein, partial [Nitrospiria bacterium]|nr:DnaJ C-terminal domain-containing protein [Nitrospiria bacterium]
VFSRKEQDLLCEATLTFGQASLGSKIEVPTLKGRAHLKIPAGTQTGKTFRIKGYGITNLGGRGVGDLLVRIRVKTPTKLSRRQRELLEEFSKLEGPSVESDESIFAKVKNIFD